MALPIYLRSLVFISVITSLLTACGGSGQSNINTLPLARGAAGEIILVMDSTAWQSELGNELRQIFMKEVPGLPQSEPYFDLRYINPFKLNDVLRSAKNMIFVTTLDNRTASGERMKRFFTDNSLSRIESDSTFFSYPINNVFARGQKNLYLFGVSESVLLKNLEANRKQIRRHFSDVERNRTMEALYKSGERRAMEQELLKDHSFYLRIPQDYDLVPIEDSIDQFVWLRQLGQPGEPDKSIIVTYREYTSEESFQSEEITQFRAGTLGNYIIADDPPGFMTIQEIEPIVYDTINFDGKFAIEARGLWKMSNITMGGPFLSYTFVDENLNRLYYIEGYVYYPGKNKRTQIRELETILRTFKTESEYQASQSAS